MYVERFDRPILAGYVSPQTYLQPTAVELLNRDAQVVEVPYSEIKAIHFVRDLDDPFDDKRKKTFGSRPKQRGLWVEFHFRDGDVSEGVVPNDLLQVEEMGMSASPPDSGTQTPRMFVPRAAVSRIVVLGVNGGAAVRRKSRKPPAKEQRTLFESQAQAEPKQS